MNNKYHAFCVAGTHSGVGKTTITLGLMAALKKRGHRVQPFKCGPDYIDAGHHRLVAGIPSRNLDTWMMGVDGVKLSFGRAVYGADTAVVEGVMGLFDGASSSTLEGSTAHICAILDIPVILVVNARAMARSIAALVHGFTTFQDGIKIAGVIANNVCSDHHAEILREALESAGLPPLLGTMPHTGEWNMPERHLGLVPETESGNSTAWLKSVTEGIEKNVDIMTLLGLTTGKKPEGFKTVPGTTRASVRIGIARDKAFHFYYEDNLDMLCDFGAELVPFSPLNDTALPSGLDGLYIGGGFPEMFAKQLSANTSMLYSIRNFAENDGHIYAECGGLMYLCEGLTDLDGTRHAMCGILPAETIMESRLNRLGYIEAETLSDGLFGPSGTSIRGHEFHWSSMQTRTDPIPVFSVKLTRETAARKTGMCYRNTLASYIHLHFASNPDACRNWVKKISKH